MTARLVLFVGDPHFKKDNVSQTEAYAEETVRVFKKCPPGTICLLAGDILDSHGVVYANPLKRALRLIERLVEIGPTVVLVGNHDLMTNQEYLSDNHWMCALEPWARLEPKLTVASRPVLLEDMVFAPYVPPGRLVEALDSTVPTWRSARCVFAHQEVQGASMSCAVGSVLSTGGDVWLEEYPPLVSGHIHTAQTIGNNVIYPGSVIAHSFGECGESAVHLVKVSLEDGLSIEPQPISVPKRRIVEISLEALLADTDSALSQAKPRDALERVLVRVLLPAVNRATDPGLGRFIAMCAKLSEKCGVIKVTTRVDAVAPSETTEERKWRSRYTTFAENLRVRASRHGDDVVTYLTSLET